MVGIVNKLSGWIIEIGKLRDGILVVAGALYLLGYGVWLINAYKNNLGTLPALESTYLVAGILPMLIFIIIIFFRLQEIPKGPLSYILDRLLKWLFPKSPKSPSILYAVDVAVRSIIVIPLYVLYVYPNLPQEFGGPQPRYAYLDVVKGSLSDETLKVIIPDEAKSSRDQIVRTRKVDVFFIGKDFVLVRPHMPPTEKQTGKPTIYEIRKDVLKAVIWCGQNT